MSREKQIAEICAITSNACLMGCEETPFLPESSEICDYLDCRSCKEARLLLNAGYRKQGWISVDERLPSDEEQRDEYGELVPFLVCEKDTTYPYRAFYDGKEWGDGLMRIRGITHWMPLPEPPIEKYTEGGT